MAIGLALRNEFDILGYLGGICILFALMFMIFWYVCSLEVEDREMPKIILPKKSKAPPKVYYSQCQPIIRGPYAVKTEPHI